jgi:hypothetical protein
LTKCTTSSPIKCARAQAVALAAPTYSAGKSVTRYHDAPGAL